MKRPSLPRTILTDLENKIAEKLGRCSYPPATASKAFARNLSEGYVKELSDRGRSFMAFVAHRFRRQSHYTEEEWAWINKWLAWKETPAEEPMPHHFTKGTVEAAIWCNKCNRETPWRIVDGKRQYCLTCYNKPPEEKSPTIEATLPLFPESK